MAPIVSKLEVSDYNPGGSEPSPIESDERVKRNTAELFSSASSSLIIFLRALECFCLAPF